mmetsp:Transcript_57489/g.145762  ORF Transcript_57489/g.145762 Transcript_57489/m.145762 type:complete len:80 (-) Transcript_57489:132-371(-)
MMSALSSRAPTLSGDDIKQKRLQELQEKSANWPPKPPETKAQARLEALQSLAMTYSDDPEWRAFRPWLKGGPQYEEGKK